MLYLNHRSTRRLSVAAAACSALMLVQCDRAERIETVPAEPVATPAAPTPAGPAPALTREDLILAMEQAASAYASGQTPTGDSLSGRRFSIRLAFGCDGPRTNAADAAGDGLARWSWDEDRRSIRLSLAPGDWAESALVVGAGGGAAWEAVEGFWIPRPWLKSDACPGQTVDPLQAGAAGASPQTVGLAAVFGPDSSRLGRRDGRAYVHTIRPEGDAVLIPPPDGYRLVLEGRASAFPDSRAIHCRAPGPDSRPVCVMAATLDRVAFEDASGRQLSEWRVG